MRNKLILAIALGAAILGTAPASIAEAASANDPPDPPTATTTITFSVLVGALSVACPGALDLGEDHPGTDVSGTLSSCSVDDRRAEAAPTWTVTVSSSNFDRLSAPPAHTIPAGAGDYAVGNVAVTGNISVQPTDITLANSAQEVLRATPTGSGNNTATWSPTITIHIPGNAIGGNYEGTMTTSVA